MSVSLSAIFDGEEFSWVPSSYSGNKNSYRTSKEAGLYIWTDVLGNEHLGGFSVDEVFAIYRRAVEVGKRPSMICQELYDELSPGEKMALRRGPRTEAF